MKPKGGLKIRKKEKNSSFFSSLFLVFAAIIVFAFTMYFGNNRDPEIESTVEIAEYNQSEEALISQATNQPTTVKTYVYNSKKNAEKSAPKPRQQGPLDPKAMLADAKRLVDAGKPHEAEAILRALLKLDPNNDKAYSELALIYLVDFRDKAKAQQYFEKAVTTNPENSVAISELINLYFERDNLEEGLSFLMELSENNPNQGEIPLAIGHLFLDAGRDEDAISYLEESVRKGHLVEQTLGDIARAHAAQGRHDKAVNYYQDQIVAMEKRIYELTKHKHSPSPEMGATSDVAITVAHDQLHYSKLDLIQSLIYAGRYEEAEAKIRELRRVASKDDAVDEMAKLLERKRRG